MDYTFELLGVSSVLAFFSHQHDLTSQEPRAAAYVASHRCTLDAFIDSVKTATPDRGWNLDQAVDAVVSFWLKNDEQIHYWKHRLNDAGRENLLIARLADVEALRLEFESLFR
jgi:hypothetical protein